VGSSATEPRSGRFQVNAKLALDLASAHGSAARFFAEWPDSDYTGLLNVLKERGSHLSGDAAMRFLRAIGKPAFITTTDVVAALVREKVLRRTPGSKSDFAAIQAAFNTWSGQSGRNLTEISRILAMSIDAAGDGKQKRR
jgi:3-methyladenine DNA glycosylase Tag